MRTDLPPPDPRARGNVRTLGKLAVGAVAMFGFAYAMIPIYRQICELTGAYSITQRDEAAERFAQNTQVDASRLVTVEFDANVRGKWKLQPQVRSIQVHPGELATVDYTLTNDDGATVTGQAIPSYAPLVSGRFFRKLECFCFRQQTLAARESRTFPVVFVLDPSLPKDVVTITLSYTFFDVAGAQAGAARNDATGPAGRGG